MPKNHIKNNSSFGRITEFEFKFSCILSSLFLFYEWTTPAVELQAAVVVVALHQGKNLVYFVHIC